MKKYFILSTIFVLVLLFGFIFYSQKTKKTDSNLSSNNIENNLQLPKEWVKVSSDKLSLKLEKNVNQGLKPQIVLTVSESSEDSSPAKYVDRLIAGARSAIPSFKIITDKRHSEENKYSAVIFGYYFNQKTKVTVNQRVFIVGQKISVLTASSDGKITDEINQILDIIVKDLI